MSLEFYFFTHRLVIECSVEKSQIQKLRKIHEIFLDFPRLFIKQQQIELDES